MNAPADGAVDWPARFRAAADVAAVGGAYQLRALATWLEQQPPSRVKAIGRELLDVETVLALAEATNAVVMAWQARRRQMPDTHGAAGAGLEVAAALDNLAAAYTRRINHAIDTPDPPGEAP